MLRTWWAYADERGIRRGKNIYQVLDRQMVLRWARDNWLLDLAALLEE